MESKATRVALALWTVLVLLFLFVPIGIILVYAFDVSNIESWPIQALTLKWFYFTWHNDEVRAALVSLSRQRSSPPPSQSPWDRLQRSGCTASAFSDARRSRS
jgi:hypothetical protein